MASKKLGGDIHGFIYLREREQEQGGGAEGEGEADSLLSREAQGAGRIPGPSIMT